MEFGENWNELQQTFTWIVKAVRQLMTNNCSNSTKVNNPEGDKMEKEEKEKE